MRGRRRAVAAAILLLSIAAILVDVLWIGRKESLDVTLYRCYANAFWHGPDVLQATDTRMCGSLWTEPLQRLHMFPHEYPPLSLAIFSLPLLVPGLTYTAAYILCMGLLLFACVAILVQFGRLEAAAACTVYVLLAILISAKVFSPQYMLWILPLAAVVEGMRLRWLLVCCLVSLIAYCYSTDTSALAHSSLFIGAILVRNGLLCVLAARYAFGPGDVGAAAHHGAPQGSRC